jgi:hypothetical protein
MNSLSVVLIVIAVSMTLALMFVGWRWASLDRESCDVKCPGEIGLGMWFTSLGRLVAQLRAITTCDGRPARLRKSCMDIALNF